MVGLVMRKMNHENSLRALLASASKRRRRRPPRRRPVERRGDHLGTLEGVGHRQIDAPREHRIDEGVGVAQQEPALAGAVRRGVRIVAGGIDPVVDQRRLLQPLGQPRRERDGIGEEFGQRLVARLEVVRPAHRADARRAVGQRDEPEPAVREPEHGDVAGPAAGQTAGIPEVPEEGRAVVARVLLLGLELGGQQRVAAGGVDDEARAPAAARAVVEVGLDVGAVGVEAHVAHPAALLRPGAASGGVAEQQFVEVGAAHLPG